MRKSDKKLDNEIRKALTRVCDNELKSYDGFEWLTHTVNYSSFPASLKVICVFDTNHQLTEFERSSSYHQVTKSITKSLTGLGIKLPAGDKYLVFDSEENCEIQHKGNWKARLS